jgi:DNA integrity scanning protein DisA with diadenylate cyclase activity
MLTNARIHEMLLELAKLDGAFIVRGDGFIRTAGAFLAASQTDTEVPAGLGARHFAAAAVTARTSATAVVVSSTDGHVRVFSTGQLVLQMDPDVPLGPLTEAYKEKD